MRRVIAAILLVAVIAAGASLIAASAYQAGLSTAITTTTGAAGTVVTPVVPPPYPYGYGYGWHPFGFASGIFGFLGTLLFLFIVFALIRAILFRGGPGRHGGWGRGGWAGYGGYGHDRDRGGHTGQSPWEARAHETFEQWHERAHGKPPEAGSNDPTPPTSAL